MTDRWRHDLAFLLQRDKMLEMEYLRELTLSVARAAAMPISSEKYDKSTSSLKRHSSVSRKEANATNLLRSVNKDTDRKVIECNKKHKKDVDKLQETLNMLGKVSSYVPLKVLKNLDGSDSRESPTFRTTLTSLGRTSASCYTGLSNLTSDITTSQSHADRKVGSQTDHKNLSQTDHKDIDDTKLPIIEHRQVPLRVRNQKDGKLTLPPCAYSLDRVTCNNFPCVLPEKYTNIIPKVKGHTGAMHSDKRIRTPEGHQSDDIWKCPESETWAKQKSLRRPIGANDRDHIFVRESAVHQIVQESRKRHEKLKIADWEVMYGEKISKSKLHKLEILRRNDPTCIGQRGSNILNGMKDKRFKY